MVLLAFISGCIGAIIGGTQVFIIYGIAGLFGTLFSFLNMDMTFYNDIFHNLFLLPAVIFNGNVLATAYASRKYDIEGWDINKSLIFTKDPFVIIMGGLGGVIGYLVFISLRYLGLNADVGAWTVMLVEIAFRLIFHKGFHYNKDNLDFIKHMKLKRWLYEILLALVIAYASGYFVLKTNILMMPFYFSAVSLILIFVDSPFPATHHISMVAAYGAMQSGSIYVAVIFGIIAQLIFFLFASIFNTNLKTHIDPPAVAIAFCSLIIFNIF